MEAKAIIYLIMGVGYVLYSLYKKGQEEIAKREKKRKPVSEEVIYTPVTTTAPAAPSAPSRESTFEELLREIRQKQEAAMKPVPPPPPPPPAPKKSKEIFVKETRNPKFEEGMSAYNIYERQETPEEKRMEAISKAPAQKSIQDLMDEPVGGNEYVFDPRQAIIGSIIFER